MSLQIKKIIAAALSLLCISIPVSTAAAESEVSNQEESSSETVIASGETEENGANIQWKVTNDGTLYISPKNPSQSLNVSTGIWYEKVPGLFWPASGLYDIIPIETPWSTYSVNNLVIEDGINEIGDYTFYNAEFDNVKIADSVTKIGNHAFYKCKSSDSGKTIISFSQNLREIEESAFESSKLSFESFPANLTLISSKAFMDSDLENVDLISNSIVSIDSYAFKNCKGINNVILSDSLKNIYHNAFANSSISLLDISKNTNNIYLGLSSFEYCTNLKIVELSNNITDIGDYCFQYCTFENITLPLNLKTIGDGAFANNELLHNLDFSNCPYLKKIGCRAFKNCNALINEIELPVNVEEIEITSFLNSSVNTFIIRNKDIQFYKEPSIIQDSSITILQPTIYYGYSGSTTEEYCNGIDEFTFIALDDARGDINYDAQTNVADAILLQNYLSKKTNLTDSQLEIADLNQDGSVNVFDNIILKRLIS